MTDRDVDEAAEDPPLGPLAGAVLGVGLAAAGLVWLVLSLAVDLPGTLATRALLVVGGLVLFVASMLWWSPGVR